MPTGYTAHTHTHIQAYIHRRTHADRREGAAARRAVFNVGVCLRVTNTGTTESSSIVVVVCWRAKRGGAIRIEGRGKRRGAEEEEEQRAAGRKKGVGRQGF